MAHLLELSPFTRLYSAVHWSLGDIVDAKDVEDWRSALLHGTRLSIFYPKGSMGLPYLSTLSYIHQ